MGSLASSLLYINVTYKGLTPAVFGAILYK